MKKTATLGLSTSTRTLSIKARRLVLSGNAGIGPASARVRIIWMPRNTKYAPPINFRGEIERLAQQRKWPIGQKLPRQHGHNTRCECQVLQEGQPFCHAILFAQLCRAKRGRAYRQREQPPLQRPKAFQMKPYEKLNQVNRFQHKTRMRPPQDRPTRQAVSSATPNSSVVGLPVSITSTASATTAPSTQPPDTDPSKLPSESMDEMGAYRARRGAPGFDYSRQRHRSSSLFPGFCGRQNIGGRSGCPPSCMVQSPHIHFEYSGSAKG